MTGRRPAAVAAGLLTLSVALAASGVGLAVAAGGGTSLAMVLMLCFSLVGALLASRRPSNPIGWLLLAEGIGWQVSLGAGDVATALDPALAEGTFRWVAAAAALVSEVGWVLPVVTIPAVFLLFPDGRLPSRGWRVVAVGLGAGAVLLILANGGRPGPFPSHPGLSNPLGLDALGDLVDPLGAAGNLLVAAGFFGALASLVARYRTADATTRQQMKWLGLASAVILAIWVAASLLQAAGAVSAADAGTLRTVPLLLIPPACAVAVLRYRLYDIDLVVSRLVLYTGLALVVLTLYVAVVVGVGTLIGTTGEPDLTLSIAATATAALAFDPARRALQRVASRAVYGRRASPYEALVSMTRRVSGGYPAGDVVEQMARSVADATGGKAEVWIADGRWLRRWACWPPEAGESRPPVPLADPTAVAGPEGTFPVVHDGQVLGALGVTKPRGERMRPAESRLVVHLADSAALVLQNARLVDELRSSRQRLVEAGDTERRRVERDLHDGAQQRLLALAITLHRAQRQVATGRSAPEVNGTLADASLQLQEALRDLRDLARGIHPAILTERGLAAAVESLADRLPIPVELDLAVGTRLDPPLESTTYFVTSEAVANIVKHAGTARARISIRLAGDTLSVEVVDDGAGGADPSGSGLRGLADRVAALGGQFEVTSPPGSGTRVQAVLPCG